MRYNAAEPNGPNGPNPTQEGPGDRTQSKMRYNAEPNQRCVIMQQNPIDPMEPMIPEAAVTPKATLRATLLSRSDAFPMPPSES